MEGIVYSKRYFCGENDYEEIDPDLREKGESILQGVRMAGINSLLILLAGLALSLYIFKRMEV
jgi:hypothetical protein